MKNGLDKKTRILGAIMMAAFAVSGVQASTVSVWLNDAIVPQDPLWDATHAYVEDEVGSNRIQQWDGTGTNPSFSSDTPFAYAGNNSASFAGDLLQMMDYTDGIQGTTLELKNALTVEAWIKPASLAADGGPVFQFIVGNSQNYGLLWREDTQKLEFAYFQAWTSQQVDFSVTAATLTDGSWHHIAATLDTSDQGAGKGVVNLYVDGVLDSTHDTVDATALNYDVGAQGSFDFWMGGDGTRSFNGLIDEVRISDVALAVGDLADDASLVPEPATLSLFGLIGGGMLWIRRRSRG
ncbi:MAG: LamG-like jellyroll fold domain-containing protein [Verrucomicrobiota bacterium]